LSPDSSSDPKLLKARLRECRRALKEAEGRNKSLLEQLGPDALGGWQPQARIERQYGWVYAWLHPLTSLMNQNINTPLTPDLRNRIHELVTAIISQLAVRGKFGIDIPLDPQRVDAARFARRQVQVFEQQYGPCDICGEDRLTHECHLLPRSEGGKYSTNNLVVLCPLHHHLFDHSRLTPQEWEKLETVVRSKSPAAVAYSLDVRLPALKEYWSRESKAKGPKQGGPTAR